MSESASLPPLLGADDPAPANVVRPDGASPLLLVCDHAGRRIPRRLGDLGVSPSEMERHIAWDIGALAVSQILSERLDATLVWQTYSRLVIDSNRPTTSPGSIPTVSERTPIPGNEGLSDAEKAQRAEAILKPYHDAIVQQLDARAARKQPSLMVAIHSFTPVYMDSARKWHGAVLTLRDRRLGDALLEAFAREADLVIGDNEPYAPSDASDYTIPVHGEQRGLHHVGIEMRQDLVGDRAGQERWAKRLGDALVEIAPKLVG